MQERTEIKVLDNGHVAVVENMGSDLSISRNARVSYDAEWRAGEDTGSDAKLIRHLYNNKHNTPFECCTITFDVKAPIFVFRQWHRHRTQSYNELSARYKPLPEEFYIPAADQITHQSTDNKQMRTDEVHPMAEEFRAVMLKTNKESYAQYQYMLKNGCPRELAREVLPVAMYSHMFATMNLHNLFGFLRERLHEHAQYEIRVYAEAMLELVAPLYPVAVQAFKDDFYGKVYEVNSFKDLVKQKVSFIGFADGNLYYETESGFRFAIPVGELHGANIKATEKGMVLMKWIKKAYTQIQEAKNV